MTSDARRGTHRFLTREPGRETRHSFSFGSHYDPGNVGFGPLVCHDDHRLEAGAGFPDHRHADVEIVTRVVSGALLHDGTSLLLPGQVAVQSAGAGVVHSEVAGDAPTRFVQSWLRPDAAGGTPHRSVATVDPVPGRLTPLVGPGAALPVGVAGASLAVARLAVGDSVALPAAPRQHVFTVTGVVTAAGQRWRDGDALRRSGEGDLELLAVTAAEVMVWSFR